MAFSDLGLPAVRCLGLSGLGRRTLCNPMTRTNKIGSPQAMLSSAEIHSLTPAQRKRFENYYYAPHRAHIPAHRRVADYIEGFGQGFDYRGETFPYDWPSVITRFGVMDYCGFYKEVTHYLRSWWRPDTPPHSN